MELWYNNNIKYQNTVTFTNKTPVQLYLAIHSLGVRALTIPYSGCGCFKIRMLGIKSVRVDSCTYQVRVVYTRVQLFIHGLSTRSTNMCE